MSTPEADRFAEHLVEKLLLALEQYPGIRDTLHAMPGALHRELRRELVTIVDYELDVRGRR